MQLHADDIDFKKIDWQRFEELCFDMLVKSQYHSLVWRQGGSDKGRDIEAKLTVGNSLVGAYEEKWFVECKHHDSGIGVIEITEKIEWAKAEAPNHFLLITNSYLTQNTREWLEKIENLVSFKIHLIEGKKLKELLLNFPDLVMRYFYDSYHVLLRELLKQWVYFDVWPEPAILHRLHAEIEPRKLDRNELVFYFAAVSKMSEEIEQYCSDKNIEMVEPKYLLKFIGKVVNMNYPLHLNLTGRVYEQELSPNFWGCSFVTRPGTDLSYIFVSERVGFEHLQIAAIKKDRHLDVFVAIGHKVANI